MSIKNLLIALSALLIALISFVFVLSTGTEKTSPLPTHAVESKPPAQKKNEAEFSSQSHQAAGGESSGRVAVAIQEVTEIDPQSRDGIMLKIQDAVATYSDEGVAVVEPLLFSPDIDIRESAIEAMKQIGTPGAAESLRTAANKSTTSPIEKKILLEAAEFIGLPPYDFKKKQ